MARFLNEIDIEAAPEAVFDELSDLRNEMRWSAKMRSVELMTGEPIAVGSRLRARWAGSPTNTVVYLVHDRPARWVTESRSWLLTVTVSLSVTATPTGSRLTSEWHLQPRGPVRLLGPVLARTFDRQVAQSMRAAKEHVETRRRPTAPDAAHGLHR